MVKKKNTCVFISGYGSNLKALLNRSREYNFPIKVKLVISNNSKARGILHAKINSIPVLIINTKKRNYDLEILMKIKKYKISLICLAGYMKLIPKKFIQSFNKTILNIHPSLLPKYKGLNTYDRIIKNEEIVTGCTVHLVSEKIDSGKIILQKKFFIDNSDDIEVLKEKTQVLERMSYAEAIISIFRYN